MAGVLLCGSPVVRRADLSLSRPAEWWSGRFILSPGCAGLEQHAPRRRCPTILRVPSLPGPWREGGARPPRGKQELHGVREASSEVPQLLVSEAGRGRLVHGVERRVVVSRRRVVGQSRVARERRREVVAAVLGHLVQLQVGLALVRRDDAVDRERVARRVVMRVHLEQGLV